MSPINVFAISGVVIGIVLGCLWVVDKYVMWIDEQHVNFDKENEDA